MWNETETMQGHLWRAIAKQCVGGATEEQVRGCAPSGWKFQGHVMTRRMLRSGKISPCAKGCGRIVNTSPDYYTRTNVCRWC